MLLQRGAVLLCAQGGEEMRPIESSGILTIDLLCMQEVFQPISYLISILINQSSTPRLSS